MRSIKILATIALLGLINPVVNAFCAGVAIDCDKIEATVEINTSSDSNANTKVKIILTKGDKNSARYIFCEENGTVLNENQFEKDTIEGLKKGKYFCIVNTNQCSKKLSFTIER